MALRVRLVQADSGILRAPSSYALLMHKVTQTLWISTAALAAMVIVFAPSCVDHQCEGDFVEFGGGKWLDTSTWESTANEEPWLDFPAQRTYHVTSPGLMPGQPLVASYAYVSPAPEPRIFGESYALAAGNLAEIHYDGVTGVYVHNDTCAHYYLRLVMVTEPPPSPPDAGSDAPSDAPFDAGTDAPPDDAGTD